MAEIDKKKVIRTAAIARFAKFIEKNLYNTDWTIIAEACGVIHILDNPRHERVRRAQGFGDSDYPVAISNFLKEVFDTDEQIGLLLIHEIIKPENYREVLSQEVKTELDQILSMFGSKDIDISALIQNLQPSQTEEFISVTWVPDDFYKTLIDEINYLYINKRPISLSVLIRKLLENLAIDILRRKYGTSELSIYYDTTKRRFHDFSILVRNLDAKKADFHHITPNFDKSISDINAHRETGNSGAHSIDANVTIEQFSKEKESINYLVRLLLRILQNI